MRYIVPTTLLLLITVCPLKAQDSAALINEALDKQVRLLELPEVPLPQAMQIIADQTGVRLEAQSIVWDLLPWGQQTSITAKIENQTLREALEAITRKLGLTFTLTDEAVELQPMPALRRLGRRSTVQELGALDLLSATPMQLGRDRVTVRELAEAVDQKLLALNSPFSIEYRPGEIGRDDLGVFVPRRATMAQALESLHKDTPLTWYPWGTSIVIVPKEDQVRSQLSRTITARYSDVDVTQVLLELSQRSGVRFDIEPGAIQRIPAEFRTIRLMLDNASIRQALDNIAGFTGLAYAVRSDSVHIWNPSAQAVPVREQFMGMIQLDNGMQIIIPHSQMPPDLAEYLQHKVRRELQNIREMMEEEGFEPAAPTPPADEPRDL